jgi:hypothetical protein
LARLRRLHTELLMPKARIISGEEYMKATIDEGKKPDKWQHEREQRVPAAIALKVPDRNTQEQEKDDNQEWLNLYTCFRWLILNFCSLRCCVDADHKAH